ncbi:MAG: RlmE family RNA methyltransferase [Rickettsiales bacterium]
MKKPSSKGGSTNRPLKTRVKTAKGRKISSTLWLERQLNDPYVKQAKAAGYRSRAAFKLIEIDDKYHLLKPGQKVVDLGAAPGGWTQVAVERTKSMPDKPNVMGIDILEMDAIAGSLLAQIDFNNDSAPATIKDMLDGMADVVLSDIGPNTTGHTATDHIRIMALAELAYDFAKEVLKPGGAFACKVWQGGTEKELLNDIKKHFAKVAHFKPKSSRKDSAEIYLVATGFRVTKTGN